MRSEGSLGRASLALWSVEKEAGGSGYAISGEALWQAVEVRGLRLLVGGEGNWQRVEKWDSQRLAPRIEFGTRALSAYYVGNDRKIEKIVGLRGQKGRVVLELGHVWHSEGTGWRGAIMVDLWRNRK